MILSVSQDLANLVTAKNICFQYLPAFTVHPSWRAGPWSCCQLWPREIVTTSASFLEVFMCPGTPPLVLWGSVEAADTKLLTVETLLASSKSKISTTWRGGKPTLDTPCYRRASMLLVEAKVWSFMLLSCWREPEKAWRVSGLSAIPIWPECPVLGDSFGVVVEARHEFFPGASGEC